MIDLDHMPPDWKFAQDHGKALKPGLIDYKNTQHKKNIYCMCCLKPIIKNQISLWSNSKQLQFLGFGFPLYFIFIKYCIILLLVQICSYSSISLYWAIVDNQQFCSDHHRLLTGSAAACTSFMIRFAHIQSKVSDAQLVLRITSFILHFITLIFIRDQIQKTKQYYDQNTTKLSQYSIIFKKLPLINDIQKKITRFIHQQFFQYFKQQSMKYSNDEYKNQKIIVKITLLPHIKAFYKLIDQKKILTQSKRKILIEMQKIQIQNNNYKQVEETKNQLNITQYYKNQIKQQSKQKKQDSFLIDLQAIDQKIKSKSKQIDNMSILFQDMAMQDKIRSQIAIVVLNKQIYKNTIVGRFKEGQITKQIFQKYFGPQTGQIQISRAPQPSQIIWQNVNYPLSQRFGRKIIGWGLTFIFLTLTTICFYFLLLLKTNNLLDAVENNNKQEHDLAIAIVYFSLVLVLLFNKLIMGSVLHYFTELQKHYNTYEKQFSFGLKYTLGLFFTTALMTLAVEAITFHNFYSHEYGVIQQQSVMFIINAFLVPLIWLINPWQLFNLGKRKIYKNKKSLTQAQANHIMSDTEYTMGKRYAQIIQDMWFTFLYATLIPVGSFLSFIGLSLYYWVDKYNLLRRSSLKNNIPGKIAVKSLKLLDFTLVLRPLGQILFDSQMRDGYSIFSIVFVVIGLIYMIIPIRKILYILHSQKFNQQQKSFQQAKHLFLETYQTLHPLYGYKYINSAVNLYKKGTTKQIELSKLSAKNNITSKKNKNNIQNKNQSYIDNLMHNQLALNRDLKLELIPNIQNIEKFNKDNLKSIQKQQQHHNIFKSNIQQQKSLFNNERTNFQIQTIQMYAPNENNKFLQIQNYNENQLKQKQGQFISLQILKIQPNIQQKIYQ